MSKVSEYKSRVEKDLDSLQASMETQVHINNPDKVIEMLDSLSLRWSFLSDDDRDYIQCCRYALEEQVPWNV